MLKLKLQSFGHLMQRTDSLEKSLMLGKIGCWEEKGTTEDEIVGWYYRPDGHGFGWTLGAGDMDMECCGPRGHKESDTTERLS